MRSLVHRLPWRIPSAHSARHNLGNDNSTWQSVGRFITLAGGMHRLLLSVVLLGSILPVFAQSATPTVDGYVTNTVSAANFSVDGFKVLCDEKTVYLSFGKKEPESQAPWANGPFLGERLSVFGEKYVAVRTIRAARIVLGDDGPHKLAGFGIIDRVLS